MSDAFASIHDPQATPETSGPQAPKLLDRLRAVLEGRHFAPGMVGRKKGSGVFYD